MFHNILFFTISFLIGQFGHVNFKRETFFHSIVTGWTTYVIHPGIFFIENFIMAKLFNHLTK